MNRLLHYFLTLAAIAAVSSVSASELTGGCLTIASPDGDLEISLPQKGFDVQDYTSMGAADELTVKSFDLTASGSLSSANLKAAVYEPGTTPEEWMSFPLTDNGNGTWTAELNADFVEIFGGGTYTLELYAEALDSDGTTQLLLNNGGQNYKIMFTLKEKGSDVTWLTSGAAQLWLTTTDNMLEYRYSGDGTRDNETMPGSTDMLAVNYFNMYYNLAEGISIVDASLQYMIYAEGESGGSWNTITCNETSTLVSARNNTYRSSFNTAQLLTYGLAPGNYTLRVMFQLIDNNGKYHFLGRDNDNFVFFFSINEPAAPKLTGISMTVSPTPGEQQFVWAEESEEYQPIVLEEPLQSCSIDEVFIFYEGAPTDIALCCKLQDASGNEIYQRSIPVMPNPWGSASTEEPTELLEPSMLTPGETYNILFWAQATTPDGTIYLNNGGDNYLVQFIYGSGGTYGDVNGDGQVTAADVSAVYNIILGASTEHQNSADVNGDGQVTAADVSVLYNIILGAN